MANKKLLPNGGLDALDPDDYDADGNLTINSCKFFKEELARELND